MKIFINGEQRDVASAILSDVLEECGFSGRVATAVNEVFVPSAARDRTELTDGDRIEVLAAMQGG